jgi:hypothetical protein
MRLERLAHPSSLKRKVSVLPQCLHKRHFEKTFKVPYKWEGDSSEITRKKLG